MSAHPKLVASAAALATLALAAGAPAPADAATRCGTVYTKIYIGPKTYVAVAKKGHVTCRRARILAADIYGGRHKRTYHDRGTHSESYSTIRAWPGWRFWTGPGGGAAWRPHAEVTKGILEFS